MQCKYSLQIQAIYYYNFLVLFKYVFMHTESFAMKQVHSLGICTGKLLSILIINVTQHLCYVVLSILPNDFLFVNK